MIPIEKLYEVFCDHPKICIDSRKVEKDVLFFAIKGERFDGHDFAENALDAGAAYAVVEDRKLAEGNPKMLLVKNSLKALQDLARFHRRKLKVPVLAITGSNGKTTTKELIAAVLGTCYPVLATAGNFNNHIGLPLTLLNARHNHEILIIEMGANHLGEIAALCQIAEPTHGLITNIGKAHLEGFGGVEGVKKGKSELYKYLANTNGWVFVNQNEPFLKSLAKPVSKQVQYKSGTGKYAAKLLAEQPFLKVKFGNEEMDTQLSGSYNFPNILTAIAVGQFFKVEDSLISKAIASYVPENNRSQLIKYENYLIILDAYNANPSSMSEAIKAFAERPEKNKWAILGDMLELGTFSQEEHENALILAQDQGFEKIIAVGPVFQEAARRLHVQHFMDVDSLREWWNKQDKTNACILLKASRGIGMEQLIKSA